MKWCVKAKERGPTLERGSWNHVNELVQVGCACVWMYHMWQVVCVVYARRHVAVRILVRTSLYSFFFFWCEPSWPGLGPAQPAPPSCALFSFSLMTLLPLNNFSLCVRFHGVSHFTCGSLTVKILFTHGWHMISTYIPSQV